MAKIIDFYYAFGFTFLHVLVVTMFTSFGVVHGATSTTTFSVCSRTPHPEICTSLIGKTSRETPLEVHKMTIMSTLAQAQHAHELVSAMDLGSFEPRARSAWTDCLELYEDSVYQLNRTLGSTNSRDTQTWLSMASTNHETCQNGFLDFNLSSHLQTFQSSLSGFSKYLSNSLAINKAITHPHVSFTKMRGRRLMATNDHFPKWLSKSDRKLLAMPSGSTSANVVVAQDGSGNYKTISEAISDVPKLRSGNSRFVIHVKAGVYNENVEIKKTIRNLMFVGDGVGSTIVTSNKNVQDGATTFRSATFAVSGAGFIARDMTFENTAGPAKHQAVAFRSGSDLSVVYGCAFKGYQDTLYVYSGRQFYRNCEVYGTQDFIFGNAATVLQSCNIYVRKPMGGQMNTITAQARNDGNENTGIIIHNSAVTAASDFKGVGSVQTFLGRPWKQYSRTVFMKCSLDSLINSAGWLPWSGSFALSTLYYGEYMNTGGGAGTGGRVRWPGYHVITSSGEATKFTVGDFLDGGSWIPGTGLPYTAGL